MAVKPGVSSRSAVGAILLGDQTLLRQLRDLNIIGLPGVSDAVHRQAERVKKTVEADPFVRTHTGLSKSVQTGRYKKRGSVTGSFMRIDYDIAVSNIKGDWPGKKFLARTWEYGNHKFVGKRFVTKAWYRMKKRCMRSLQYDIKQMIQKEARKINKRVANEVRMGLR